MVFIKKELKSLRIKKPGFEIEPEEVLWDAFTRKKEELFRKKLEVPLRSRSSKFAGLVFLILVLLILGKTFQLQGSEHQKYVSLAQKNKFIVTSLTAQRGVIYDKDFKQLTFNRPSYNLVFKKDELPEEEELQEKIWEKVAWILGIKEDVLKQKVEEVQEDDILVAQDLDYQKLILLECNSEDIKGFDIENVSVREYPQGPIFSHLIGYYRKTGESDGLERSYSDYLSPQPGKVMLERDVYGNVISEETVSLPESGKSLVLWLDAELQERIYRLMSDYMRDIGAKKGVAVAINPKTGGVLAMLSFPSFDNNLFSQGVSQEQWEKLANDPNTPFLNRVIAGRYATGSTIKPLIGVAALEEGIISEYGTINCQGEIVVDNPWYPDKPFVYHDWQEHGITDIRKAIARSCNVFFYTVGGGYKNFEGLGPEKIKNYLELFGWARTLGIDLPGEENGFIPDKEWKKERFSSPDNAWMPGDTYNLAIGQGFIGVTPLEVVSAFASLVNGGKVLKPQIVKEIIDEQKNVVEEFSPEIIQENFVDEKNLEIVKEGMRGTVTYGTAQLLNGLPVAVAGKTGTAQTGKADLYHSWLTVFAPYDDPQIVLTLMVEDVPETYAVVLSTALNVLNWYFGGGTPE
jgi:penicillin-binding protein 2